MFTVKTESIHCPADDLSVVATAAATTSERTLTVSVRECMKPPDY